MAPLPQGPYILAFSYFTAGLSHDHEVNCDTLGTAVPGSDPSDVLMAARSEAAEVTLQEFADEYFAVYRTALPTLTTCATFTLWKAGLTNTVRTFISGGNFATPNGSGIGAYVPAQQLTVTMRSASGRIGRFITIEPVNTGNVHEPVNIARGEAVDLYAAYIMSARSPICGRDRSYFVQAMNFSLGQNEAVWEDRFRS
jgi:hypothetical protein